jgi:3alpha(or 20beta)-hydroxysteroid dehydrogenase
MSERIAVVTGGNRGLGLETCRQLVERGYRVVLTARDVGAAEAALRSLGGTQLSAGELDVANDASIQAFARFCEQQLGRLDALVNNAGIFTYARLTETSVDDFTRQFDVNQLGVFLGMRAVAPTMKEAGQGSIINISSAAGLVGMANTIGYTATKWAVRGMTKSAAVELGRFGVRVNSIHPGVIDTELLYENPVMRRDDLTPVLRSVPLGRMAQPSEVATVALFLASDEASYCTGGEFIVDGGVTAS